MINIFSLQKHVCCYFHDQVNLEVETYTALAADVRLLAVEKYTRSMH
jgi:hypothetical protein